MHPIALTRWRSNLDLDDPCPGVKITATARTVGKTGVEMEAQTAVSVAALTGIRYGESSPSGQPAF